jgi:hypothetical protein
MPIVPLRRARHAPARDDAAMGETGGRMVGATIMAALTICMVSLAATHYLAAAVAPSAVQVAQARPPAVKQSIEQIRSVLDPVTTGSVQRNASAIVLDPCTGARK